MWPLKKKPKPTFKRLAFRISKRWPTMSSILVIFSIEVVLQSQYFVSSNSVCNHTRMITDRIGLHSALLPLVIKTITKFLNAIGHHQHDLSANRRVYASCL